MPAAEPILQIEGLEVAVDDTPILKGVDLAVPQGEVLPIAALAARCDPGGR